MLQSVKVENLALLSDAVLELGGGFVCLTGETGAGKSLVIDALSLLSGGRASSGLIRTGCRKAVVEAELLLDERPADFDLLDGDVLFLRREVQRDGRSRAFVNGAAVPLSRLAAYATLGFELHGQHGQQHLLDERRHLEAFDRHMNLTAQVDRYRAETAAFKGQFKSYWDLQKSESERLKELDVLDLQISEIERVGISEEDEDLELRLRRARNSEEIRSTGADLLHLIEDRISPDLQTLDGAIARLGSFLPTLQPYGAQIQSAHAVLNELMADLQSSSQTESQDEDLEALERRASEVNRLYLKYGSDVAEVLGELQELKRRREELNRTASDLDELWQKLEADYARLSGFRKRLDEHRQEAIKRFCQRVSKQLHEFSLPGAEFDAAYTPAMWAETLPKTPRIELPPSRMRFLIAPNPGEGLRPLAKIASGGELSRVLLALITGFDRPADKTLVFDEVDAGISGETALKIGAKLAALGRHHQVLCVTHLAQVACFADQHVRIEKSVHRGRTFTRLDVCDQDERVAELARLMGGDAQAAALREHAKSMMVQAIN